MKEQYYNHTYLTESIGLMLSSTFSSLEYKPFVVLRNDLHLHDMGCCYKYHRNKLERWKNMTWETWTKAGHPGHPQLMASKILEPVLTPLWGVI
jgi:hypothetical protein